jgi:hypothetical protein
VKGIVKQIKAVAVMKLLMTVRAQEVQKDRKERTRRNDI